MKFSIIKLINIVEILNSSNYLKLRCLCFFKFFKKSTKNREIMGATNPADARPGTVRKDFALDIEANSIHGSDSAESAEREINFFFSKEEIVE